MATGRPVVICLKKTAELGHFHDQSEEEEEEEERGSPAIKVLRGEQITHTH